jgi:hypothetical protein
MAPLLLSTLAGLSPDDVIEGRSGVTGLDHFTMCRSIFAVHIQVGLNLPPPGVNS